MAPPPLSSEKSPNCPSSSPQIQPMLPITSAVQPPRCPVQFSTTRGPMPRKVSIYLDSPTLYLCPCATTPRRRLPAISRIACLAAAAGCATIALATTALYSYESNARRETALEASRLSTTLAHVRQLADTDHHATEAALTDTRQNLAAARQNLADTQQRLTATGQRLTELQSAIAAAPASDPAALQSSLDTANRNLAAAVAANTDLSAQLARLRQSAAATVPVIKSDPGLLEHQRSLESANADLQSQIDTLKSQLLQLAAQSTDANPSDQQPAATETAPKPLAETRWALGITYDTAQGFANLCFDRNSLRESPADPYRKSTATRAEGASTFRFVHDAAHDRVFAATLTLSLSPDAPRDRLTENAKLAALFVHTFAPACRNPDEWLAAATRQLAGKDASQRLSFVDTTYKITASNDAHNTFTFKIESPRNDLED